MTEQEQSPQDATASERLAARDSRMTEFLEQSPEFEMVNPLIEPPLDITRSMLQLLNMRDETVIVHEPTRGKDPAVGIRRGVERGKQ